MPNESVSETLSELVSKREILVSEIHKLYDIPTIIDSSTTLEEVAETIKLLKLRDVKENELSEINNKIFKIEIDSVQNYKESIYQYIKNNGKIVHEEDIWTNFESTLTKTIISHILYELERENKIVLQRNNSRFFSSYFIMTDEILNKRIEIKELDKLLQMLEKNLND